MDAVSYPQRSDTATRTARQCGRHHRFESALAIAETTGSRVLGIEQTAVARWMGGIRKEIEDGAMNILSANLKHFAQRRSLWLIYAFIVFLGGTYLVGVFQRAEPGQGHYIGLIVIASVTGLLAASMQVEILIKPFSFTLPNHRRVLRRFLFLAAFLFNLPCAMLFVKYAGLSPVGHLWAVVAAFFAGHIAFWVGAGIVFLGRNSAAFMGFFPIIMLLGILFDLHVSIERIVVAHPLQMIIAGGLTNTTAWFLLGTDDLLRRYCDKLWLGILDAWNLERQKEYARVRKHIRWKKLPAGSRVLEQFFLKRMQNAASTGVTRTLLGQVYATFGLGCVQIKRPFIGLLLMTLTVGCLGYFRNGANIIFFMPALIIAQTPLPVYSSLLTSGGRRERFISSLTIVVLLAVIVTVFVTGMAALTTPLKSIMPPFMYQGIQFSFGAISPRLWYIPLAMTPIVFTLNLLCVRRPVLMMVALVSFFTLMFLGGMVWREGLYRPFSAGPITALVTISWVIFPIVLGRISSRHALASQ